MRSSGEVCRAALAEAWLERFGRIPFERVLGGPALVPVAAFLVVLGIGLASRGFAYSRTVHMETDRLFGHVFVLGFTLMASTVLVVFRGARLHGRGWRFKGYLGIKTALVLAATIVIWAEGGWRLRALIPGREASALIGGLLWSLIFMASFICVSGWCFADQRRRCPVCLRRLSSPVSMGTWASVFEPATTELVCTDGHGLLCESDNEGDPAAQWTTLDATWKGL